MALWSKKKPAVTERVLEFNVGKLKTEMQNLSTRLGAFKEDISLTILEEVLHLSHNIELLDMGRHKNLEEFHYRRGRLEALHDISDYISRSKNAKPKDEKKAKSRDAIKMVKRADNQAGLAI